MTQGLRKVLGWREEPGEEWRTRTHADLSSHPICSESKSTAAGPALTAWPTAAGPPWISVSQVQTKPWGMPAQQAEPPKLRDQGEQKPRESRVLTGPEAAGRGAIKSRSHRGSGTRWRPRLCSRSWVSKAPRGALVFPFLPLPRTGAPSSCLVVRASQDGWRRLGNSGGKQTSLATPKESLT